MRYFLLLLVFLLCAQFCRASEISEVSVDEGLQQLIIAGHFELTPGTVTVDSVDVPVLSWSDSLIVCHIDSDGVGSCGPVQVHEANGSVSNVELLTWIGLRLEHIFITGHSAYLNLSDQSQWNVAYRTDLNYRRSLFASRASSASYSYSRSGDGDGGNYGGKPYSVIGSGAIRWLSPDTDSENGFQVYAVNDSLRHLTISFSSIRLIRALEALVFSPPNYSVDTFWEDYTFSSTVSLSIHLDSLFRSVGGVLPITSQFAGTTEYYSWNSDTTKFAPPHSSAGVNNSDLTYIQDPYFNSAYPNPSSGVVRIAYQLPAGVASGEVILTDEVGRDVKRYHVTSAFSDLEISEADLPSGAYFYKIVTQRGESALQKIVRE